MTLRVNPITGKLDLVRSHFVHNNLRDLQGGTADEYYHLTAAEQAAATRDATNAANGLMPAGKLDAWDGKAPTTLTTDGDLLYYNSGYARLAAGDDGKVLTLVDGLPSWEAAGGGGGGGSLDDLTDVSVATPSDNQALIYDTAGGLWGAETIDKTFVGLGNVDNTADIDKPISSAVQTALNAKASTFLELTDTPATYTAKKFLQVNAGATALEVSSDLYVSGTNCVLGTGSGASLTSGDKNVLVGTQCLIYVTTGAENTCIGYRAGMGIAGALTANYNVFVGSGAGASNSNGSGNVGIGRNALNGVLTGNNNIALGIGTGSTVTSGSNNIIIGGGAGISIVTSSESLILGYEAAPNCTTSRQVAIGYRAAYSQTSGFANIVIGASAAYYNQTGQYNVIIGEDAAKGASAYNGSNGIFIGYQAGTNVSSHNNSTMIGYRAGYNTTTGSENFFLGSEAGRANVSGSYNVFIGYQAGYKSTSTNNIAIGWRSGFEQTSGTRNCYVGTVTGYNNSTGNGNTCIGYKAGNGGTGGNPSDTTAIGDQALIKCKGARNTGIGAYAGFSQSTGNYNTYVGRAAGYSHTGSSAIIIGLYQAAADASTNYLFDIRSDNTVPFLGGIMTAAGYFKVYPRLRFNPQATPASPVAGDAYFDSSSNKLRVYDGSGWNDCW